MQLFPEAAGKRKWGFLRWMLQEGKSRCSMDDSFWTTSASPTAQDRKTTLPATLPPRQAAGASVRRQPGRHLPGRQRPRLPPPRSSAPGRGRHSLRPEPRRRQPQQRRSICHPARTPIRTRSTHGAGAPIDQGAGVQRHARPDYFKGRLASGYWSWELTSFPAEWMASFRSLTKSGCRQRSAIALSAVAAVPVRRLHRRPSPSRRRNVVQP